MALYSRSNAFNNLTQEQFRELTKQLPFYKIAQQFNVSTMTISRRAKDIGAVAVFCKSVADPISEIDLARIVKMRDGGKSFEQIKLALNRSYESVRSAYDRVKEGKDPNERFIGPSLPWPRRTTNEEEALRGRRYEDAAPKLIEKEWPARRAPLNGFAYVMRAIERSTIGCAAVLCMEN